MTKVEDQILFACYRKKSIGDRGFISKKQESRTLYYDLTENIEEARLYTSKRKAATAMGYRNMNHPDLCYFTVKVTTTFEFETETEQSF